MKPTRMDDVYFIITNKPQMSRDVTYREDTLLTSVVDRRVATSLTISRIVTARYTSILVIHLRLLARNGNYNNSMIAKASMRAGHIILTVFL